MIMKSIRCLVSKALRGRPGVLLTIAAFCLAMPCYAPALDTVATRPDRNVGDHVLTYKKEMKASELAGRPATDKIEFSHGRQMSLGDIRQLREMGRQLREAALGSKRPAAFNIRPGAPVAKLNNAGDLAAALKRPDTDTVELKGKPVTVGMIKLLRPLIEKKLGRLLDAVPERAFQRPNTTGTARKVNTQTNWKEIQQLPEDTILESPKGKRITVGMLKKALAKNPNVIPAFNQKKPGPAQAPKQR